MSLTVALAASALREALPGAVALIERCDRQPDATVQNSIAILEELADLSKLFVSLRGAMLKEADAHGVDVTTWSTSDDAALEILIDGFSVAIETDTGALVDLAAATRAEQRWELGAGK